MALNSVDYDLRPLRRQRWLRPLAALVSGILPACAFAPLDWWPLALAGLIPVAALPQPRRWRERLATGAILGYAHFAVCLHWLNTVGFGAGWLLAGYCALFPMAWYCWHSTLVWNAKPKDEERPDESDDAAAARDADIHFPGAALGAIRSQLRALQLAALSAAGWIALEWLRGWLFTGFPWNQLGYAFAEAPTMRQLAAVTGVYGLSFIAVFSALAVADAAVRYTIAPAAGTRRTKAPLCLIAAAALLAAAAGYGYFSRNPQAAPEGSVRLIAIQGDLPILREWDESDFLDAWAKYADLTRKALRENADRGAEPPAAVVWPEGAIPPAIIYQPYAQRLRQLLAETNVPMLIGALDLRGKPGAPPEEFAVFNSAFLLDDNSPLLLSPFAERGQYYDKIHLVPFGEFTPFSKQLPWLAELIGMGRDLTAGQYFRLFEFANGARAGVNICFEDAFPEISRRFTNDGADFLVTLTDDCWYLTSAGARQHRNHAVFRAIENRRALLRSGNNSDTCLIDPAGAVLQPVLNGGFGPGWQCYEVPCLNGKTIYNRCGNLIAWLAAAACTLYAALLFKRWKTQKRRFLDCAKETGR